MSDTPETDAQADKIFGNHSCATVLADFARKLERERNEARHEIEGWKNKWNIAVEMAARAENERDEARYESDAQARLLGMSAEREESLRGKLFLAERELAKIKEAAKSVVEIWETPPWKIDATPSKAITQLRDAICQED